MKTVSFRIIIAAVLPLLIVTHSHGATLIYKASLSGPAEDPPNASPGVGSARLIYDEVMRSLQLDVTFSGLLGVVSAAHIHAPTILPGEGNAGVATALPSFPGFPSGVSAGSYSNTFDLSLSSSWNPAFIANNGGTTQGATLAFATALADGKAYLNIHTNNYPPGEIRGFFRVPDPSITAYLLLAALGALLPIARRVH